MNALQTDTAPPENGTPAADSTPRLAPIETPDSWWVWLAYKLAEWTEGTVITPMKVVQARLPESLRQAYETQKLEEKLSLPVLGLLLHRYVAFLNGCATVSSGLLGDRFCFPAIVAVPLPFVIVFSNKQAKQCCGPSTCGPGSPADRAAHLEARTEKPGL